MNISEELVLRSKDSLDIIFSNSKSRKASRLFITWLKTNNNYGPNYATKTAVSDFANSLQEGILDSKGNTIKYSRVSFYGTIIKTLVRGGFLQKDLAVWSSSRSKTMWLYAPYIFKLSVEPPSKGFHRISYYICKKWNNNFV